MCRKTVFTNETSTDGPSVKRWPRMAKGPTVRLVRCFCRRLSKKTLYNLDKFSSTVSIDAPSIDPRSVVCTRLWTQRSFLPNCKGPPQGPLVGHWGFVPRCLDYKITLIRVRHLSTKINHFLARIT